MTKTMLVTLFHRLLMPEGPDDDHIVLARDEDDCRLIGRLLAPVELIPPTGRGPRVRVDDDRYSASR